MLIQADARSLPLADASVQCVVTSPPYFGLRDYGTGTWVDGDPACDHRGAVLQSQSSTLAGNGHGDGKPLSPALQAQAVPFRDVCGKCGARRVDRQLGLEQTPAAYITTMVQVFREVRRVLKDDGVVWLNLGDSYANDGKWGGHTGGKHAAALHCSPIGRNKRYTGLKAKDLCMIPARVALALQEAGWYLRSDVIWSKPNCMPESVTDRPTRSHEYVFLLTKSARYYYDAAAIRNPPAASTLRQVEDGYDGRATKAFTDTGVQDASAVKSRIVKRLRDKQAAYADRKVNGFNDRWNQLSPEAERAFGSNARSVWTISPQPFPGSHFATMPEELAKRCILAGSRLGDVIFDPFVGSGTVARMATSLGRRGVGCDLSRTYLHDIARERVRVTQGLPLEMERVS